MNSYDIANRHGMMIKEEVVLLKSCVMQLTRNPTVVNIGAGFGTSAAAILEERPGAFIYSVDIQERPEEAENLIACELDSRRCVRMLGVSWEIGVHFPHPVELLFVDGSHKEKAVLNDTVSWLPKVVSPGFVLFHDYHHKKAPGVTTVVDSMMKDHKIVGTHRYLIAFRV